jgi:hypothetical protein
MFALILISTIAAIMFHRRTREKGYFSHRFWMYPLIVGNGLLLFTFAVKWIAREMSPQTQTPLMTIYGHIVDLFAFMLLVIVIGKAWKQIQALPPLE